MSELDPSQGSVHETPRARDAEVAAFIGDRAEREGLPRHYRMRADAHYVDQLDRVQAGPVVRLIATRHIDACELPPATSLTSLSQSIATHGMLQPLLVRRAGSRYQLIAGRRRFAAALNGGMTDVPCIIHEVNEAGAHALADAERASAADAESAAPSEELTALLPALSQDLARIASITEVLELATNPFQHRTAADFLKAETWRTAWLVNAAALVSSKSTSGRTLSVSRALDGVRRGFEPELRLTKRQLETTVTPECADLPCDERFGIVVTGLLFVTLLWLDSFESPRIEVRVDSPAPHALRMQMLQRVVSAPAQPTTPIETLAFAAARVFAGGQGGGFDISALGPRGALMQLVFNRPQHA